MGCFTRDVLKIEKKNYETMSYMNDQNYAFFAPIQMALARVMAKMSFQSFRLFSKNNTAQSPT